jgi:hydroxymethylglutaryl-CoA lyase
VARQAGRRIHIQEVGLRDGLQAETRFVPTARARSRSPMRSRQAGLAKLEVSSFVSPKAVPVLADAVAVFEGIARRPGVVYSALVPNSARRRARHRRPR